MSWKAAARRDPAGFYRYRTERGEVRIFMTPELFDEMEDSLGAQIQAARRFPGVVDVAITPDAHTGYGVPVGCVMATRGTLAMGPVGYDIGCGMCALRSSVAHDRATPERIEDFSRQVMRRVGLGGRIPRPARLGRALPGGDPGRGRGPGAPPHPVACGPRRPRGA